MKQLLTGLVLATCMSTASATMYNVEAVLPGGGGFGASLFHDASGANVMSGNVLADIPDETEGDYIGVVGTYDDVTGAFTVTLNMDPVPFLDPTPTSVTLHGTLFFDALGKLDADYALEANFLPPAALASPLIDTFIGFKSGYVCCGSTLNDPNTFNPTGALIMTLWGANFDSALPWNGEYDNKTNLGLDLRLRLTEVPVPAAAWLFGTGLIGLVGVARRKA